MQVVLHAGAHMTDEDRLIRCLAGNAEMLSEIGTNVPSVSAYRKLLRDIVNSSASGSVGADTRDIFLDAVVRQGAVDRLVLSNFGFFGTPKMAIRNGIFYPSAPARIEAMRQMFPNDEIELFLAIRNPATFIPALMKQTNFNTVDDLLNGTPPASLMWSELITRLRTHFPDMPMTIWCNEDTPLIWGQVVREMGGLDPTSSFEGEFSLLSEIMTQVGMQRFESYLEAHPGMTEIQKRRVISAFLDKFAKEDEVEEELDLPGWTEALIDDLSELYDEDVYTIPRLPGVNVITP